MDGDPGQISINFVLEILDSQKKQKKNKNKNLHTTENNDYSPIYLRLIYCIDKVKKT